MSVDAMTYSQAKAIQTLLSLNNTDARVTIRPSAAGAFFLTGAAGTGKTWVASIIQRALQKADIKIVTTASTGVAALNVGGKTIHRLVGWQPKFEEQVLDCRNRAPWAGVEAEWTKWRRIAGKGEGNAYYDRVKEAQEMEMLFVDEASMLHSWMFEWIDNFLCHFKKGNHQKWSMGGVAVVFVGDMLQLPAVSRTGERQVALCESEQWKKLFPSSHDRTIYLSEIVRQAISFDQRRLDEFRCGKVPAVAERWLQSRNKNRHSDVSFKDPLPQGTNAIRLYGTNRPADEHNHVKFSRIKAKEHKFKGRFIASNAHNVNTREWASQTVSQLANDGNVVLAADIGAINEFEKRLPDQVVLLTKQLVDTVKGHRAAATRAFKIGSRVMLLVNRMCDGVGNGSTGTVCAVDNAGVTVLFDTGPELLVTDHVFEFNVPVKGSPNGSWTLGYQTMPLMYAWAVSIHKSQGLTFDHVEINLSETFEVGQAYVALSRARKLSNVILLGYGGPSVFKTCAATTKYYESLKNKTVEEVPDDEKTKTIAIAIQVAKGGGKRQLDEPQDLGNKRICGTDVSNRVYEWLVTQGGIRSVELIRDNFGEDGVAAAKSLHDKTTSNNGFEKPVYARYAPSSLPNAPATGYIALA
jgi:hypothetical protein